MDINTLLQGLDCGCGKHHTCDIKAVYIEPDVVRRRLPALCAAYKNILLVADENTFRAGGEPVAEVLADKTVKQVIYSGKTLVIPNEDAVAKVMDALDNTDLIIGVGSGVIQDICKYVSFQSKIPYYIIATAPSMDGYASAGAAMITEGMKVTYSVGVPTVILADTNVLKNAPLEMIKSGYGDIVGKFSSLCDWKLAHAVNGEYFCDFIYDLTYDTLQKTLQLSEGLLKRDEESICVLMEALVIVGIAIAFAGSSRPASGSEHHLSHFFEITGIVTDEPYLAHGIDVAYSAVITTELREKLLAAEWPDVQQRPERKYYEKKMKEVYKSVAQGCIALQDKLQTYEQERTPIYREKEAEIRAILKDVPTAAEIQDMLAAGGLFMKDFYDFYSQEKIENAIRYAKDLKDRYTVLWMYYDIFGEI